MSRTLRSVLSLDAKRVAEFFEQRACRYRDEAPYSSVMYQDKNPEIAVKRDSYEKGLIKPLLEFGSESKVLDIGCGIGRWAEVLASEVGSYTGVDISPGLIGIARRRLRLPNVEFLVASAGELGRLDIARRGPFDLVIMSGIMIYLNDEILISCLEELASCVVPGGQIYMREPLAVGDRLTLSEFWSDELGQHYSAIYRSASELQSLFADSIYAVGFEEVEFCPLYKDAKLNNRVETVQHFAIAKRSEA